MKKILFAGSAGPCLDMEDGLFRRAGFRVTTAATGEEALLMHQREKADLIVAELELPDMGGDELCARVRRETEIRNVSFILVCPADPGAQERASRCGANACVSTPVRQELLLEKIEQLLAISTRRGYRVLLRARVHGEMDHATFFCTSHNISVSGMLIETEKLLEKGNLITCMFFLPGSQQITVEGDVVRAVSMPDGGHHYGIRFNKLNPQHGEVIERFIAASTRKG